MYCLKRSSHTHNRRSWYLLGVLFQISVRQAPPSFFIRDSPTSGDKHPHIFVDILRTQYMYLFN